MERQQGRQSMEGVTELQGDGIDVGNLTYCQGRVKMSMEPTCSRRKSLCWSIACQSGTEAGKRKGGFETLAALPNEQQPCHHQPEEAEQEAAMRTETGLWEQPFGRWVWTCHQLRRADKIASSIQAQRCQCPFTQHLLCFLIFNWQVIEWIGCVSRSFTLPKSSSVSHGQQRGLVYVFWVN